MVSKILYSATEKKMGFIYNKICIMATHIHIREHLYIWILFTLNYAPQNPPEVRLEFSMGCCRSKSEHLAEMLTGHCGALPV